MTQRKDEINRNVIATKTGDSFLLVIGHKRNLRNLCNLRISNLMGMVSGVILFCALRSLL